MTGNVTASGAFNATTGNFTAAITPLAVTMTSGGGFGGQPAVLGQSLFRRDRTRLRRRRSLAAQGKIRPANTEAPEWTCPRTRLTDEGPSNLSNLR